MAKIPHRLYLTEDQMPKQWYNLRADMKEQPDPLIHPGTHEPLPVEALYPIFCEKLARQELDCTTRYFDIPEPVLDMYKRTGPRRCAAHTIWKRRSTPRRRSTTSSRATTPRARTSSIPPSRRRITPRSRASRG